MKVWHTLRYQFRSPLILLIHLALWVLFFFLFDGPIHSNIYGILQTFIDKLHVILILSFITSYRLARGKLNGIADTQQQWMNWYHNQDQEIPHYHNHLPQSLSEYLKLSSVLITVKNIVFEMFSKPMIFVFHFICWHTVSFLGILLDEPMQYTIRENQSIGIYRIFKYIVSDMSHEYIYVLVLIAFFALITCLQDVIGKLIGIAQEHRQWLKWHEDHNESFHVQNNIETTHSLISNETGLLFVKREPVYTIIYVISVMVIVFIIPLQLIPITDWSGIKSLSWVSILLLLLR